jgi:uncharacterized protein (TIGR02646 family)
MIRIVKPTAPAVLLTKGKAAKDKLCRAFTRGTRSFVFKASIYAAEEVKDALLEAQHRKCAFCESLFRHISYGDIEHFRPKAGYKQQEADALSRPGYYWLAYDWDNLFYSCQLCNQRFKKNLFPLIDDQRRARSHADDLGKEEPLLVHPSRLDPASFIGFREERAYPIKGCLEGETTIAILGLNRPELAEARGRRLQMLQAWAELCNLLREKAATGLTPALSNRLRALEEKLRASKKAAGEYAAMARAFLG